MDFVKLQWIGVLLDDANTYTNYTSLKFSQKNLTSTLVKNLQNPGYLASTSLACK